MVPYNSSAGLVEHIDVGFSRDAVQVEKPGRKCVYFGIGEFGGPPRSRWVRDLHILVRQKQIMPGGLPFERVAGMQPMYGGVHESV